MIAKWIVAVLGFFGITLLVKNAEAAPAAADPVVPVPVVAPKWPYEAEIRGAAGLYHVDPDLLAAIVSWEQRSATRWDPRATNPDDPSYGLGQVTPYIGVRFGIIPSEASWRDLYDPAKNLRAVAAFLAYLLEDNSLDVSIQMYNLGEPKYWDGKRVPEYLAGVLGYYRKFRGA